MNEKNPAFGQKKVRTDIFSGSLAVYRNGRSAAPEVGQAGSGWRADFAIGGERGIRTPETLAGLTVFKTVAFDHSAISPRPIVNDIAWMGTFRPRDL
tara:strand:+ start:927 stop:1217 length:291 start_codon:yes stop_codon:yes gene_type:complete